MIERTIQSAFAENWPMILIFTTVIVAIRLVYIKLHNHKIVLYRELFMLAFLLYVLVLFYVVTFQDVNYGTNNFIPFKEILRYEVGSKLFIKNILGNIILFIPYGMFVSYIFKTRKSWPILVISLITSGVIEYTQMQIGRTFYIDDILLNIVGGFIGYLVYVLIDTLESHLPAFFSSDTFRNIMLIVVIIVIVVVYTKSNLWGILR